MGFQKSVFLVKSSKNKDGGYDYEKQEKLRIRRDYALSLIDLLKKVKTKALVENTIMNIAVFLDVEDVKKELVQIYRTTTNNLVRTEIKKLYEGKVDITPIKEEQEKMKREEKALEKMIYEYETGSYDDSFDEEEYEEEYEDDLEDDLADD